MPDTRQRIDKWLWYARMARTRTLAQKLVSAGRIRINRKKCDNPADPIRLGDVLTIPLETGVRVLRVVGLGTRRGSPADALTLYEDLSPSDHSGESPVAASARTRPAPSRR
jgi:ribosome-associated heat shock protein Hsp15